MVARTSLGIILLLLAPTGAWSRSGGAPAGHSGAPGEPTCTACHGGTPNSGSGRIQIQVPAGALTYAPGQSIRLTVNLQDGAAQRWGFQLTARSASSPGTPAGVLSLVSGDGNAQILGSAGAVQFATHTSAGTRPGTTGSASWNIDWTPPASGGPVTLYVAGNAANGNNIPTGDLIYTSSITLEPESTTPSGDLRVLPQLAFGGGWYSALYFYNAGESVATFPVHFYGSEGQALPVGGAATQTVTLQPRGSTVIEAPNVGNLTEGWAAAEAPLEVEGYGVFRQSVPGRPDQEAVVPLSGNSTTSALLIFDDTAGLRTAVGIANPSSSDTTVMITARDDRGQAIGSPASVTLRARGKRAVVLAELPGLSGITGRRGSVEFSVQEDGAVAVLGLRFAGSAFTSIPAIER